MDHVTARGVSFPALGLGTWPMTGPDCREAVATALDLGYRHVDTAQMYGNEADVGDALAESDVPRSEVFVVTKVRRENLAPEDVLTTVRESVDRLGTHADLLLVHAPSESVPIPETIEAMNDLRDRGLVDHLGVSNFDADQLETAIAASAAPIITNQVAYHPYRDRSALRRACRAHDVVLTAYSPLAEGAVVGDETLAAIGEPHGKTAAQVALRWLVQQDGVAAIPKASTEAHLRENLDVFDFSLSPAEMERVASLAE